MAAPCRRPAQLLVLAAALLGSSVARAQLDERIAEEPTGGLELPLAPLAGEPDVRVVTTSAAQLTYLAGTEAAVALTLADGDRQRSSGAGGGVYLGMPTGGRLLPRGGLGLALEWLRPARAELDPDPGSPTRFTLATATALGRGLSLGASWHHSWDGGTGALAGLDTFDLGFAVRRGNRLALTAGVLDVGTPTVATTPVQRRYELELALRPTGRDGLEVAFGGRVGEVRGDLDGWARAAVRLRRGLTMQLGVDSRALHVVSVGPSGRSEREERDLRATLGLELSFGTLGLSTFATAGTSDGGVGAGLDGGTMIARLAAVPPPSMCCAGKRAERLTIEGDLGGRAGTALALRLRALAADASLAALVVTIESVDAGWATIHELRHELELVRRAGTKVYAYLMTASTKDYVLATAADKIFLDPAGSLGLVGLASTKMYWQGALEIVGAQPEFDKIAEYKSAPEQYTERGPSEAAARMHRELADSMMATVVRTIAGARGLTPAAVRALIDAGPYHPGRLGTSRELIDAVATPAQVAEQIGAELGDDVELEAAGSERADRWQRRIIAVIHADGEIADGASRSVPLLGTKVVGAQTIVAAIAAARADDRVGAIVLRIDSPGGSAVASELMAREVFATRGKKPILCSMGDVAASGGYYLAAGCDQIFADELTITGSIGIFSGKFDLSGTLGNLGVATHTERRGAHADMDSLWRPYTPDERENVRGQLRYMYDRFVATVAEGRGMTVDEVDAVARGRVWTGVQAKAVGLVDTFGGLTEAIAEAKRRMGLPALEPVQLWHLPKVRSGVLSLLMGGLRLRAAEPTVSPLELPAVRALLGLVPASVLLAPGEAQARIVPEWAP